MDFATVKSIAQSLHGTLQCSELKELCSAWKYESELEKLERTVSTIKAVILDAEAKHEQHFSHQKQLWVKELKDALYDADDLFDELSALAEQKQLMVSDMEGGNLSKKQRS
uniref:Disease resistance N-terminal domain-containing protein n=1 Tax=Opuntia streptacantha TaxID=393608 RepID=A0A7C9D980_OPUST